MTRRVVIPFAIAAASGLAAPLHAKPPLQKAYPGAQIEPLAIARVKSVEGRPVLDGDWIPYTGANPFGPRTAMVNAPFFDSYGREPALAPTGTIGTNCIGPCDTSPDTGGRWYFGSAYHNPNTVEDLQECFCPPGSVISEIDFAFFWAVPEPSHCIVVFRFFEDVTEFNGTNCGVNPADMTGTGGAGIAIDLGFLPPSTPHFYFSRAKGLYVLGALSPATNDTDYPYWFPPGLADGSYQMIIADSITSSGVVLASGPAQPMLWGTSTGGATPGGPGLNNDDSYDDDSPTDGTFKNPGECYNYTNGLCPDPWGKCNAFCYLRCPADYNNDGFVDGIDADMFFNDFETGGWWRKGRADLNGDCFTDGLDADLFYSAFDEPCP